MYRVWQCLIVLGVVTGAFPGSGTAADCDTIPSPRPAQMYAVHIDAAKRIKNLTPQFFGFNIEWVEFQLSLWDSAGKRVAPQLIEFLSAFPGAVYRYPGGTVANYFDWHAAVGDMANRRPQQVVSWRGPLVAEFGPAEFLTFVQAVNGQPWYVLNLYGRMQAEWPQSEIAKEARELARALDQERQKGLPRIYRWELGNELDRDRFLWRPEKYADVASAVFAELSKAVQNFQAVALSQDWDAAKKRHGLTASEYNRYLGGALSGKVAEFASHHYYDGKPWGPPVPHQLRQHCRSLGALRHSSASATAIWVTEHGRTPEGTPADKDWQRNWPQTASLAAAISVADMLIALSQDPSVKGAFIHALHATKGPWPLFHRHGTSEVVPSAVYWALRILREALREHVLATRVDSANSSGYEGGYDLRAVALGDASGRQLSVWLVNRASRPIRVTLHIPSLRSLSPEMRSVYVSGGDSSLNNYLVFQVGTRTERERLTFNVDGKAEVNLPANAVATLSLTTGVD